MEDSTVDKDSRIVSAAGTPRAATAPRAAVALKYNGKDRTPEVVASGVGDVARQIVKLAEDSGVAISTKDSLGEILSKLDIENSIPADAFPVVAEVLAFLYRADSEFVSSRRG